MFLEWISHNKKKALVLAAALGVVIVGVIIWFVFLFLGPPEEEEVNEVTIVSNSGILYNSFSDYQIGYIINAIDAASAKNSSMKNGQPLENGKSQAVDPTSTNDLVYPTVGNHHATITIKDGRVTDFEDEWGLWKTFTIETADKQLFKVDVAIGAHNRINDVAYMPITITKL